MSVPSLDLELGLEVYLTKTASVGGVIRKEVDDFVVEEVLVDGSKARVNGAVAPQVLGATSERRKFLLCVMIKRDWDTFIALKNIAKQLGIDQGRIQIAGIKDAKAVTAQHLTIDGVTAENVAQVKLKDIQIAPIGYMREALSTYYLTGNCFTIKIRMKDKQPEVKKAVNETMSAIDIAGGFPNFFGHQRFGTIRPITHLVGKALIRGDFKQAAMLFLAKPSMYEHPASRQARQQLQETFDFKQSLKIFPRQLRFERIMLSYLAENTDDFLGAFQRLPLKLQELFVQAYQSYLFNRFLSSRLKYGYALNKAEVGDYVVGVERSGLPLMKASKIVTSEMKETVNQQVKAGKMRVALPIIGLRQKLSENVMGQIERQILEQEEVKTEEFRVSPLLKITAKGGLRTIVTPVRDFKLNVSENMSEKAIHTELSFMLLRGCYATVLLREIMKPANPLTAGF